MDSTGQVSFLGAPATYSPCTVQRRQVHQQPNSRDGRAIAQQKLGLILDVYFFAGPERHGDIKHWLQYFCSKENINLEMHEFDLLRDSPGNDLALQTTQDEWLNKLHLFSAVINTPPCSTFSRAPWANRNGPVLIRSCVYPLGFPWLSVTLARKAEAANHLIAFFWKCMHKIHTLQNRYNITAFGEHPEDLGRIAKGEMKCTPVSIWQMQEFWALIKLGWWSGGFKQDKFGAPTAKPTRGLSNS